MRTAFKEWAAVVDALGRGDQIVALRKGGIAEGAGGFQLKSRSFLLFPTFYHQQRQAFAPGASPHVDRALASEEPGVARIEFAAEVVEARWIDSVEAIRRIAAQGFWREDPLLDRFYRGPRPGLWAWVTRVSRLPDAVRLPDSPAYGGCRSWIELEADVSLDGARPVVPSDVFDARRASFLNCASESTGSESEVSVWEPANH